MSAPLECLRRRIRILHEERHRLQTLRRLGQPYSATALALTLARIDELSARLDGDEDTEVEPVAVAYPKGPTVRMTATIREVES